MIRRSEARQSFHPRSVTRQTRRLARGSTVAEACMSSCPDGTPRFPGRSDQRDHARIRRRSQDELPGRAHHFTPVGFGGQQNGRPFGFRMNHADRTPGAFMREQGVAARRLVVQLAWVYAAASDRASAQPGPVEGAIGARDASGAKSPTTVPWLLAARVAEAVRHTVITVVGWLARGRR
jgi:hypothetical protein